jgi:hypothetical protein
MGSDLEARRGLRAFVATAVIGLGVSLALGGVLATSASATPPTHMQRAQRGAQWLANQIKANHGFVKTFGAADITSTAYAVMGMRATGVDKPASQVAINYLKTKIGTPIQLGGKDSAGALAEFIMAAVANATDPRHFGGTAPQNNLVNRLLATQRTTGADAGLFGAQDPTYDGAFRQGLALAALKAVNIPQGDAHVIAAISWLSKQQCANGLWMSYRSQVSAPCPAANASTFSGPDTNSTGIAVQGLAAYGSKPRAQITQQSLKAVQSSDGGFPFIAAANQASDPNSTALVMQALIAVSGVPIQSQWNKGTHTPYTALASFQLGCAQPGFGAFFFPGSKTPNTFATVQAVPAMASKAFPIALSTASVILPLTPC